APDVDGDLVEPGPQRERLDTLGGVRRQRAIGAHKRILRDLLRVGRASGQSQRQPIEPSLIGQRERLESGVEVTRQRGEKRQVVHACCPSASCVFYAGQTRRTQRWLQCVT